MTKHKQKRVPKSEKEIIENFNEQTSFLINAASLYDNGNFNAIKMATPALRTLFYKQKYGDILIDSVSTIDKNKFISTVNYQKESIMYAGPVVADVIQSSTEQSDYMYLPACYDEPAEMEHFIPFDDWWNGILIISGNDIFKRCDMIRYIANQDGGSHVDLRLEEKYYRMVHNFYSLKVFPLNVPIEKLHLALTRQIVHEALISFKAMHVLRPRYVINKKSFNIVNRKLPVRIMQMNLSKGEQNPEDILYN